MTSEISATRPVEPYVAPTAESPQTPPAQEATVVEHAAVEPNPQVISLSVMYGFIVGPDGVARCQEIKP